MSDTDLTKRGEDNITKMSQSEYNVRPDSLPDVNPAANYPLQGIIGRVIVSAGASDQYLDPRGIIFNPDVKPIPFVPLETRRYLAYQREFEQAQQNIGGGGYSVYEKGITSQGYTEYLGKSVPIKAKEETFLSE